MRRQIDGEWPEEYAQRRANETRSRYLITGLYQVLWACPQNRKLATDHLGGIVAVYQPA